MRKAQTSLTGVLIAIIGATLVITFMNSGHESLKLSSQAYLKQYNQQLLANTLQYENAEGMSVKELLAMKACGASVDLPVNEAVEQILKPGYDYILQAGNLTYYSREPQATLKEMLPSSMTIKSYCGNNITIIAGAYQ